MVGRLATETGMKFLCPQIAAGLSLGSTGRAGAGDDGPPETPARSR